MDAETRLRQTEALNLLTNRILMDFLSLQIDKGLMTLKDAKALLQFSEREVIRGASQYEPEVNYFAKVLADRFDSTFEGRSK
jgi:hypothetical protein